MGKKLTTEEFIEKAKQVHGDKYDYSKTIYKGSNNYLTIICPKHGEFEQRSCTHLEGKGCIKCGIDRKTITTEDFVKKAKQVHGDKYDYSKTKYDSLKRAVTIICPKHGEFRQRASSHLKGCGCIECGKETSKLKKIIPITKLSEEFNKIHNDKYSYDFSTFVSSKKKMKMFCQIHGEFWQTPASHLDGHGCPKCAREHSAKKHYMGVKEFVDKANVVHRNKYDYSKVIYNGCNEEVVIICPKHGEFKQNPSEHLRGHGCKFCHESKLENEVNAALIKSNISFERQKRFKWLGKKSLDFYLPQLNIGIECQGEQHYKLVRFGGKNQKNIENVFKKQIQRDIEKKKLCEENGVKIFYFTHYENSTDIKDVNNLIKTIIDNG